MASSMPMPSILGSAKSHGYLRPKPPAATYQPNGRNVTSRPSSLLWRLRHNTALTSQPYSEDGWGPYIPLSDWIRPGGIHTRCQSSGLPTAEVDGLMRHLLFLTAVAGILCAIDAIKFGGRYRAEIWQEVTYKGQAFNREVEYRLRRALW
jgi:hypothetical protein